MVNLKYAIKYYALNDTLLKYTQRTSIISIIIIYAIHYTLSYYYRGAQGKVRNIEYIISDV